MELDVYLYFKGNCREAMEFYKGIFGGELKIATYGESGDAKENKDWIIHCELSGGDIKLMAADGRASSEKAAKVELSLVGKDEPKMKSVFQELSAGGRIHIPLDKQSWGDLYGRWTDKFGIIWSMNISNT